MAVAGIVVISVNVRHPRMSLTSSCLEAGVMVLDLLAFLADTCHALSFME